MDTPHRVSRLLEKYRTCRRRRKLKKGYRKIAKAELDKDHGFTPTMHAWTLMERDGHIELNNGELEWKFP